MRCRFAVLACGLALLLAAAQVHTQSYPNHPIRMIVPFSAGGTTDVVSRTIAQKLGEQLGQPVIVENRAGANGNIGIDVLAKSPPDGYTLVMSLDSTLVINPHVYDRIPFDALRDFAPITKVADLPLVLVAHPSFPANNARELISYAKAHPGVNYASAGYASTPHLMMILLERSTGTRFTHVPYKGGGSAIADVLAGQVPLFPTGIPVALPHIASGKLKAIAISMRHPALPAVESFAEAGFAGVDVPAWIGLLAPARTPQAIVDRLHREVVKILMLPDIRERFLTSLGSNIVGNTPQQFAANISADSAHWAQLIAQTGIKVE
jgi:tripartite-type tricarboxylate transporter receptor subunit TctC